MKIVFSGKNLDSLYEILSKELIFRGSLFEFNSAEEYINSLKLEPPLDFEYEILQTYENKNSVCLIYQFTKNNISTPMAQLFEFSNDKITKIQLIFNANIFV